jgi:hypothetical protein
MRTRMASANQASSERCQAAQVKELRNQSGMMGFVPERRRGNGLTPRSERDFRTDPEEAPGSQRQRPSSERDLRVPRGTRPEGQAPNETFGSREGRGRKAKPRTRPSGHEKGEAGRPSPERDLRVTRRAKPEGRAPNETFGSREGRSRKAEASGVQFANARPSRGHQYHRGRCGRPWIAAKQNQGGQTGQDRIGTQKKAWLGRIQPDVVSKVWDSSQANRTPEGCTRWIGQVISNRFEGKSNGSSPRKAEPRTRPSGHERDEAGRPSPNETFGSREGRSRKAEPRTRPSGPEKDEAGRPSPERDLRVPRRTKPEGRAPNETFGSREGRSRKAEPRTRPSGPGRDEAESGGGPMFVSPSGVEPFHHTQLQRDDAEAGPPKGGSTTVDSIRGCQGGPGEAEQRVV